MGSFKQDKKEEEANRCPFTNLDKTSLLQETRYFNETPVNNRRCIHILTKILYFLNQGEPLTTQEATDTFFATTKLFQSKDVVLRRIVYLLIKKLSGIAQDVIIVTSSLTKDMTGKEDMYRAAAIRALCSITDCSMVQAIERYMKQAIVDKNAAVSSAALVSALHLARTAPELVRRWSNEAQEAMSSDHPMVSYHALGVVAGARKNDKLASAKLVSQLIRIPPKSPYALCLLIRQAALLVEKSDTPSPFLDFIECCLRHKSEIVIYEAAHAIVILRNTAKELAPAVSVLQLFCGSSKPSLRLAGTRTLARLTEKHSSVVSACAVDLENLISDSNRSVATLAVTTLLATGAEASVDRLMKQISSFVSEISDEFKIVVVKAIRRLCSKFPRKHQSLAAFLAAMLRDEGGLEYKAAIADALIALVEENLEAKETGLAHLCEFIEDCEHQTLAIRILHLLGREGPKSRHPSRYIRFIYNRVFLESGPVRAAAVSALARFGAQKPELLANIKVLLARCQLDEENEVRDRAILYTAILESNDKQLIDDYIINLPKHNPVLLDKALRDHIATNPEEPFDIMSVPQEEDIRETKEVEIEVRKQPMLSKEEYYMKELDAVIPDLAKLGPIFKTSSPEDLTEPDTEYQVRCIKHVFTKHLILQFECLNTIADQLMENVRVQLEVPPEYEIRDEVQCPSLPYNQQGSIFVILEFPYKTVDSVGSFAATLQFTVRDCDPTTGIPEPGQGYPDEYQLEELVVGCAEQLRTRAAGEDFESTWERCASTFQACETFVLPQTDVKEACEAVCSHLGLPAAAVCGEAVKEVRGVAVFRNGAPVAMRARLALVAGAVTMQVAARSPREDVAQLLLVAIS